MTHTGTAMSTLHRTPPGVYSRACELRDRLGITDSDEFGRLLISVCHQEFMRTIEPWRAIKARLFLHTLPPPMHAIVRPDGSMELVQPERVIPAEFEPALQLIDERIEAERRRYFDWLGPLPEWAVPRETPWKLPQTENRVGDSRCESTT